MGEEVLEVSLIRSLCCFESHFTHYLISFSLEWRILHSAKDPSAETGCEHYSRTTRTIRFFTPIAAAFFIGLGTLPTSFPFPLFFFSFPLLLSSRGSSSLLFCTLSSFAHLGAIRLLFNGLLGLSEDHFSWSWAVRHRRKQWCRHRSRLTLALSRWPEWFSFSVSLVLNCNDIRCYLSTAASVESVQFSAALRSPMGNLYVFPAILPPKQTLTGYDGPEASRSFPWTTLWQKPWISNGGLHFWMLSASFKQTVQRSLFNGHLNHRNSVKPKTLGLGRHPMKPHREFFRVSDPNVLG